MIVCHKGTKSTEVAQRMLLLDSPETLFFFVLSLCSLCLCGSNGRRLGNLVQ